MSNSTTSTFYTIQNADYSLVPASQFLTSFSTTPSGTSVVLSNKNVSTEQGKISPSLYIKYVKSKLSKLEQKRLKHRLSKLQKLVKDAKDMGQQSFYENLTKMLAIVVRESEAFACGVTKSIDRETIDKYINRVKENPVKFTSLDKFPRSIPSNVKRKIKSVQDRKLFDKLDVLFLDYSKEDNRTNKEKIRDKDPILFGSYAYQPDKLYFIIDWVDEYCDLTLDKFVDAIKESNPEYELSTIPEMDETLLESIKKEVLERHERLSNTKPSNYKELMNEEDKVLTPEQMLEKLEKDKPPVSFWKRLFRKK